MHTSATATLPAPSSPADTVPAPPESSAQPRFRGDIQGLRAVAVLAVLGFHAGLPFMPGGFVGVDVFFVISGFLITGLVHREVLRTGTLSLGRFWARRIRRLLPATAVVLGAVAAVTVVVLPVTRWSSVAWDIGASAVYAVNWRLADQSVDYMVSDDAPSPVQHFWSLAVEEQFYVLWPLLLLALLWVQRRTGTRLGVVMLVGIALIGVPSLLWSVHLTQTDPGPAYFVSTTRLWELAIGAALAVAGPRLTRLPMAWAQPLGALGLAAIAFAIVEFDASTPFPGAAALVPTLGAAAVIAAGMPGRRTAAGVLLDAPVMRDIGTLSYSLYLWHWPLLVAAAVVWGGADGTPQTAVSVLVVGFAVVPAWLTYRLVEEPIHHARMFVRAPRRAAVLGVACTVAGIAAALVVAAAVPKPVYAENTGAPGAAVLDDDPRGDPDGEPADTVDAMVPEVLSAPDDVAALDGELCISDLRGNDLETCTFGPADADISVAVVGDSKAHQWLTALQQIAEARGWRLVTYLKSACPLTTAEVGADGEPNTSCASYNDARFQALLADDSIDYVVTSQVAGYAFGDEPRAERTETMAAGLRDVWQGLEDAGRDVVVIVDNPNPRIDVMECVAMNEDRLGECTFSRTEGDEEGGAPAQVAAASALGTVGVVDLRDYVCPRDRCPAVIGDTLVYRRGSHLTATYVRSLTPRLDDALLAAMQ